MPSQTQRDILKTLAGLAGVAAVGPGITAAEEADDRYVLRVPEFTAEVRERLRDSGLDVIHELEHVGYVVVQGEKSAVEATGYEYIPDLKLDAGLDRTEP